MDFDESWPMPTERMEVVEVVCGMCKGEGETEGYPGYAPQGGPDGARYTCFVCQGAKALTAEVPEGSLTAARLRLADAAEAVAALSDENPARDGWDRDHRRAFAVYEAALAALRSARGASTKRAGG